MRTIKFRGKRVDNGEWVYGYLHLPIGGENMMIQVSNTDSFGVIPDTVGQFTVVLDKNGKEIYEGDIVCANHFFVRYDGYTPKPIRNAYNIEIDQKGLVTSVLYSRNYAIEFYPNKGWIMRNGSDQHRMHSIKGEANIEVIGNIHDNPELMKQND